MKGQRLCWVSPEIRQVAAHSEVPTAGLEVLPESHVWRAPRERVALRSTPPSRWREACWLEVEPAVMEILLASGRWILLIKDASGTTIYKETRKGQAGLSRSESRIAIDPALVVGKDPRSFVIRAHFDHREGSEEVVLEIPESFRLRHGDLWSWIDSQRIPDRTISFCPIGGLANQLYQAAAMLGFSRRNDIPAVCEVWKTDSPSMVKRRPTYWNTVFSEIVKLGEGVRRDPRKARNYGDPSFTYTEIPREHEHQILWGHYLSYKYFHEEREELLDLLWGNEAVQREVDAAYERLAARVPNGAESLVSIHVRRGDSLLNSGLTLMNMRYWEEAMAQFPGSVFAIFSDDLAWCRDHFRRPDVMFVDGNPDWVDLYLMARCDHNIIVNSTYSWWSAYLNRIPDRRVVYPMPWFAGKKRERDMSDFFLPDWTRIEVHENDGLPDARVFGIGLSRTGTKSLTRALERLGYRAKHYPPYSFEEEQIRIQESALTSFGALTDTPIALAFEELDRRFPGSKFVYTVRDLDDWLASCEVFFAGLPESGKRVRELCRQLYNSEVYDRNAFRDGYLRHHDRVMSYFSDRPDDLLVMNILESEPWQPLCEFLEQEVPGGPFPHHK